MKGIFYPKLAWIGIKKNKQTYMPYLLTCIGMVMMFYIISFLSRSDTLYQMSGGDFLQEILGFGVYVMGFFTVIFLFYTNTFLIRRRKKEFGLYNILGMGKWNLARMLVWESLMMYGISMAGGISMGILLSKMAELCVINIMGGEIPYDFRVDPGAVNSAIILFAFIFALILLNTLRQIHVSKPVELLHSENFGEKPPKANWVMAAAGLLVLGAAYYVAVSLQNPMEALLWFFVAVLMVIVSTYVLFISGSVALCRLLQKRKRFYYKTNHFVAVSSMSYRMKRNGAGLASICILSTMVLVMISTTSCLYFGKEGGLRNRYPQDIILKTYRPQWECAEQVREAAGETCRAYGEPVTGEVHFRYLSMGCMRSEDYFVYDEEQFSELGIGNYADLFQLFLIPVEDYNEVMGQHETLEPDEMLLYTPRVRYSPETITVQSGETMRVKRVVEEFKADGTTAALAVPSIWLIVPDFEHVVDIYFRDEVVRGKSGAQVVDYYGFDLACGAERQMQIMESISEKIRDLQLADETFPPVSRDSIAKERSGFFEMYGSLFFLGILLGIVFIFATVLIIYYKQISEGYEDQSKFGIMQKVGMTGREIKKSINSQVMIVFFLPLVVAGVHTAFAFPMLNKILMLFAVVDLPLLIWTTVACFILFAFFYIVVFVLTSRAYYRLVSR